MISFTIDNTNYVTGYVVYIIGYVVCIIYGFTMSYYCTCGGVTQCNYDVKMIKLNFRGI